MSTTEMGHYPKPGVLFNSVREALGVSHIEMTPFEEIPPYNTFELVTDQEIVHPWHLTHLAPVAERYGNPVVYGLAKFATNNITIRDRAGHWLPHGPGPEHEHVHLNIARARSADLGIEAPVEKGVMRDHIRAIAPDETFLAEFTNTKVGELAEGSRIRAIGVALGWLRDLKTGEVFSRTMIQYSDKAPESE